MTAAYLLAVPLLWVCFFAYIQLRNRWSMLRPEVKLAGIAVVFVGFVLDVAINWTLGLLLGITKDFTLSQKCKRLQQGDYGYQTTVARYLCHNWLDPFDPEHC